MPGSFINSLYLPVIIPKFCPIIILYDAAINSAIEMVFKTVGYVQYI